MTRELKVTYEDGREESFALLPFGFVLAERHFSGDVPPFEGTLYAAWAIHKPNDDFEAWCRSLASMQEVDKEVPLPKKAASPAK